MTKEEGSCARCGDKFSYFYETGRKPKYCSEECRGEVLALQRKVYAKRLDAHIAAIRSGTLNPRAPLPHGNGIAIEQGVLVPPSAIPANDFAWTIEPPLPKQSWVFDVDGVIFHRLTQAETAARGTGHPIYCRPAAEKVAVNQ
jgi:hypothetical protein